jgi:hypothetical protein
MKASLKGLIKIQERQSKIMGLPELNKSPSPVIPFYLMGIYGQRIISRIECSIL